MGMVGKIKMKTQYFTFGIHHALSKFYVRIEANSINDCRQEMFNIFGATWAFQYNTLLDLNAPAYGLTELPLNKDKYGFLKLTLTK